MLDVDVRWPELFTGLTAAQCDQVIEACADVWLEGWEPNRDDVADLADLVAGRITAPEYDARATFRAETHRQAGKV